MENLRFQTEVRELLHMMIHSVYSNKEIFLRELIANAADAIDKARFLSLTQPEVAQPWEIRITPDPKACTLSISDNGIGMTREEVIENLGTIAHSGTKAFLENLAKSKKEGEAQANPELIGQFGVGFYASFMVADKVVVDTLKAGGKEAVRWESNGEEEFTLGPSDRTTQGTTVTLHLKEEDKQYLEQWRISSIVKKYSDFIEHPIKMLETRKDKDGKETTEDRTLNSQKAIWLRPESEVKPEEYESFYQHLSGDMGKPLVRINYSAEGTSEFKALLFLPERKPWGFEMPGAKARNLHLYIRRVFITDDCKGLIPEYLRRGKSFPEGTDLFCIIVILAGRGFNVADSHGKSFCRSFRHSQGGKNIYMETFFRRGAAICDQTPENPSAFSGRSFLRIQNNRLFQIKWKCGRTPELLPVPAECFRQLNLNSCVGHSLTGQILFCERIHCSVFGKIAAPESKKGGNVETQNPDGGIRFADGIKPENSRISLTDIVDIMLETCWKHQRILLREYAHAQQNTSHNGQRFERTFHIVSSALFAHESSVWNHLLCGFL